MVELEEKLKKYTAPARNKKYYDNNKEIILEKQKEYIGVTMKGVSIDVIEPYITEVFEPSKYPAKPIVTIHSREQRESINIIKAFYQKFPQFRWISFRDMRALPEEEFANSLKTRGFVVNNLCISSN